MAFNAGALPQPSNEYVAWVDVMGIQSAMSRSLKISANFVFKLHIAALSAPRDQVQVYPVMDGFYACAPRQEAILAFLRFVFSQVAQEFVGATQPLHRFIVRGGLAFGPVIHGNEVGAAVDPRLEDHDDYKSKILLGMPIVQANASERLAPPFGIYIHESARAFAQAGEEPFHHVWWKWVNQENSANWNPLLERLTAHYEWCKQMPNRLIYDLPRIDAHQKMAAEYFLVEPNS
ncbi:hypothetical protein ACUTAH_24625 [Metapseudomonas furukawaii]|uniref:hypothetical protein n=1 Tax=Metapseudomonas furukawaii TaxID=1149133 RepID=UPI0040462DA0